MRYFAINWKYNLSCETAYFKSFQIKAFCVGKELLQQRALIKQHDTTKATRSQTCIFSKTVSLFARAVNTFLYVLQPFRSRDVKSVNFFFLLISNAHTNLTPGLLVLILKPNRLDEYIISEKKVFPPCPLKGRQCFCLSTLTDAVLTSGR